MIRKVTQLLFLTAFALLLFSPAIAEAGSCCYYWTDHPDAVVGTSHHLGCDFYNTDLAIEAVYSCEIPSANEILCWQELAGVLTPSQPCPDEGDDNITATGYANMFGATWEDDGSCLTLSDESGGNYYKDSYSGSGAQASCSELATENNDPNFQARLDIAEGLVVVTGVHMAKCVCWGNSSSAGLQNCNYENAQLDFDATVQTEAEFQTEYAAKCTALNISGSRSCAPIKDFTKDSNLSSYTTSIQDAVGNVSGKKCDMSSVGSGTHDVQACKDKSTKPLCEGDNTCLWSDKLKCVSKFDVGICSDLTQDDCKKSESCGWNDAKKECVHRNEVIVDEFLKGRYGVPPGYQGPLPDCAFSGTCRNINDLLQLFINYGEGIFAIIAGFAFAFFVYGGFLMIFSFGNAERVKQGQQVLIAAVIGLIIVFSAYIMVDFLLDALGVVSEFRGI